MQTHRIKMTSTQRGKDDDPLSQVKVYEEGEEYDVGPQLFRIFTKDLEVAKPVKASTSRKTKAKKKAPENKSGDGSKAKES